VAIVVAAVAGVLVVGLVGIVVVNALRAPQTQASPGTYSPVPPTYSALLSIPTSSTPVTTPPTTSTTPPRTTPPPTATPRTTQPPAPPQPQPVYTLGDNPLFGDLGLSKVQCSWPAYQPDLAAQKAHFTAVFACLGKAWAPVMAARNLPFTPPTVYVFDQPMAVRGCDHHLAQPTEIWFECDGAIYVPARYFPDVEHILPQSFDVFLEMAAHEYGHYVQELSGVIGAYNKQLTTVGVNSSAGLLFSRRLELQAQCFSGMFFASALGSQDLHDAKVDANLRGDHEGTGRKEDHGTPERSGAWFGRGGDRNSTEHCNTWNAPANTVE